MASTLFHRNHWPYPTTKRQVIHLVILLAIIILLGGIGAGAWLWHTDHTPISAQEVTLAGNDLASYASEAAMLVSSTSGQSLTKNYRDTYAQQLHDQIQKSEKKLTARQPSRGTATAINQLIIAAHQLDHLVTTLPDITDHQGTRDYTLQFKQLQSTIQATEKQA